MSHSSIKIVLFVALHTLFAVLLGVVIAALFIPSSTLSLILQLLREPTFSFALISPIGTLLLFSFGLWTGILVLFRTIQKSKKKILRQTRGAIMTETLVILPVFFLLLSGLAQLSINEMAGLLTTVATFEAGRTVAVWAPEVGHERFDSPAITLNEVRERARVSAAAILTPVARDLFRDTQMSPDAKGNANTCTVSPTFTNFASGMESAGIASQDLLAAGGKPSIWSYADAFGGTSSFFTRAPVKLRSAYCAISISNNTLSSIPTSGKVGADFKLTLTYQHQPVFPLVSNIFGDTAIQRTYVMRSHVPPNHNLPK